MPAATFAALLVSIGFALLSLGAALQDPAAVQAQLRPMVADGSLTRLMPLPLGGRQVPAWEGNDCLVLTMLAAPQETVWRDALSPRIPRRLVPDPAGEPGLPSQARCLRLAELLDAPAAAGQFTRYDRYLHGHRVVGALLMRWIGPSALRHAVPGALVTALAGLALLAGARAWRRRALPDGPRHAAFAWLSLVLLLFQGVPVFGLYWTHTLSDLVPALFLWLLYLRPPRADDCDAGPAALLGAFGSCVALFEFLTGGLPLAAALLLLIGAAQRRRPSLRGSLASLAAFGAGALVPFAAKILIGHLAFDDFMMAEASSQFLHRLHGPVLPEMAESEAGKLAALGLDAQWLDRYPVLRLPYTVARLAYFSFVLGSGSTLLGLAILGVTVPAVPVLAWRAMRRGGDAAARAAAILGGIGVVLAWYGLFLSHTLLHAVWMVRCLAVLPLALGLLLIMRGGGGQRPGTGLAAGPRTRAVPEVALTPAVQGGSALHP